LAVMQMVRQEKQQRVLMEVVLQEQVQE